MSKEINLHLKITWAIIAAFFAAVFILSGGLSLTFFGIFAHDYKEPICFNVIDHWYRSNNINTADNYQRRWQQHLECERNMGLFPWGKEPQFSK